MFHLTERIKGVFDHEVNFHFYIYTALMMEKLLNGKT